MKIDCGPELEVLAGFYDERLVGDVGPLGFRRSTELRRLLVCLPTLADEGILLPGRSSFLDLGCGDGRVNALMSYLTRVSIGVEIDDCTLDEEADLRGELDALLERRRLRPVPDNIHLFRGDATNRELYQLVRRTAGIAPHQIDIFYAFSPAHQEFAALIAALGRPGCTFLVYAVNRVFPCYPGLERVEALCPLGDVLAVYRKPGG